MNRNPPNQGKIRKRSSEDDEDGDEAAMINDDDDEDDEEYGEDGEYLPDHADGRVSRHSLAGSDPSNAKSGNHYQLSIPSGDHSGLGRSASTGSHPKDHPAGGSGSKSAKPIVLGPDGQPPPKKKRRRQALSCTECKRRKIRCDRAHPCAPCTRRGDADKCKWNILEPADKFVTRKEYDEIKDSLSRLENILSSTGGERLPGTTTEQVAIIVDKVKKQAGLLGKVISATNSNTGPQPIMVNQHQQSQNHMTHPEKSYDTYDTTDRLDSSMFQSGPSGIQSHHHHPARNRAMIDPTFGNGTGIGDLPTAGNSLGHSGPMRHGSNSTTNGPTGLGYAYPQFALNVPSQSPRSDDGFYGRPHSGSVSSQAQPYAGHSSQRSSSQQHGNQHHMLPSPSHTLSPFSATAPTMSGPFHPLASQSYHRSGPNVGPTGSVDLGGLVVEDQSSSSLLRAGHLSTSSLSTLAHVANSTRPGLSLIPPHSSPVPSTGAEYPVSSTPSVGTVTLAPITVESQTRGSANLPGTHGPPVELTVMPPPILPPETTGAKEAEMKRILQANLPRKEICDRLVAHYFEKVEWSLTLLHRPTFMRAYESFWLLDESQRCRVVLSAPATSTTNWGTGFRASFLPPTSSYSGSKYATAAAQASSAQQQTSSATESSRQPLQNSVTPSWISLLFAVLCVSLEKMGFFNSKVVGITAVDDYRTQCRSLYDASQRIMVVIDFVKSPSLEIVQALVLHTHCHQSLSTTNPDAKIATIVSAGIRVGMMMGLNRLPPESQETTRRPGFLKRELGRRAWWNLIERDWNLGSQVGRAYTIHSSQNFTEEPNNTNWQDLSARSSATPSPPRGTWTNSSCFLARIDLARFNKDMTDQYNTCEGVSYDQMLKQEAALQETVLRLPPQLHTADSVAEEENPQIQWDRIHISFLYHYTIIMLHRPYLVASLLESRTSDGTPSNRATLHQKTLETCVRSAEVILNGLEEAKSANYPGLAWWQTTIYCYTAALVLLIERWYTAEAKPGSLESEDAEERRRKIVATIGLLQDQGDSIELFALAANAIDSLLDATTSARRKARRHARKAMDLNDVVNPVNVSTRTLAGGNTPPFVREWIERPTTPLPGSEQPVVDQPPSLSTLELSPGAPLLSDASYDSKFWARVFDMEFEDKPDSMATFFTAESSDEEDGQAPEDVEQTSVPWEEQQAVSAHTEGNYGKSAIWDQVSGSLGGMDLDAGWKPQPYDRST